jgi:hypothetical protein
MIKDHISLDLKLPATWTVLKNHIQGIEVLPSETQLKDTNFKIYSLVCKNTNDELVNLEKSYDNIIKYNLEKQEKEKLFKLKIQELKTIFEKEQLDNLKNLKIDFELNESLLDDEGQGDRTDDVLVQDSED